MVIDLLKIVKKGIWIKEVILENFMSYEYARIPLNQGLNLICGPNGSGKSSILLAISVALGQVYTERSKRLRDLIRRGKDIARVSLVFDNRPMNGKRPISFSNSDEFMLSRYLKKDGTYWYEADYKEISSYGVNRLFKEFGMNPDNMLIIMHQNTMEQFGLTTPQEKLKLLEEAVGFSGYREKILESRQRLERLMSEEESLSQILEKAEGTLDYWKEMYEKWIKREEFIRKIEYLKREEIWARIKKQEMVVKSFEDKMKFKERAYESIIKEIDNAKNRAIESKRDLDECRSKLRQSFYSLVNLEKEKTGMEMSKINDGKKEEIEKNIGELHAKLVDIEEKMDKKLDEHIRNRVDKEVSIIKKGILEGEMREMKEELEKAKKKLAILMDNSGERISTDRNPRDIEKEIGLLDARIQSLGEIPKETEEMHSKYSNLYEEIKEKSRTVIANRERGLKELKERKRIWKKAIKNLLKEITPSYKRILSKIGANGVVRLVNAEEIEESGLELMVGFRGLSPVALDAYSQSGGERSACVMAFLLSIQQQLKSPFRAIDEFDIHMDPRNRESICELVVSSSKEVEGQCLLITPSQITMADSSVHVIVVQNVYGRSRIREVNA
jgi:chromosome segregation protein